MQWQNRLVSTTLVTILLGVAAVPVGAMQPGGRHPGPLSGGVLAESYRYHRVGAGETTMHGPMMGSSRIPRYQYGFPVSSYRWGWFGASRYYPRSFSHHGYNGDYWHWAYRRGY